MKWFIMYILTIAFVGGLLIGFNGTQQNELFEVITIHTDTVTNERILTTYIYHTTQAELDKELEMFTAEELVKSISTIESISNPITIEMLYLKD